MAGHGFVTVGWNWIEVTGWAGGYLDKPRWRAVLEDNYSLARPEVPCNTHLFSDHLSKTVRSNSISFSVLTFVQFGWTPLLILLLLT